MTFSYFSKKNMMWVLITRGDSTENQKHVLVGNDVKVTKIKRYDAYKKGPKIWTNTVSCLYKTMDLKALC